MVRITPRSTTALEDLLTANHAPPEAGVRLVPNGKGSLGMVVDAPHEDDEVIRHNETPVLIVDSAVADHLADMMVDYQSAEDDHQTPGGFVLRPQQDHE